MKIIHAADFHLDYEPKDFPNDGYAAFSFFLDYCKEHPYYPVIIAGDLFNPVCPSPRAYVQAQRLEELRNDVYIIPGNHEFDGRMENYALLPLKRIKNVHVFDITTEVLVSEGVRVQFLSLISPMKKDVVGEDCQIVVAHGKYSLEATYHGGPYLNCNLAPTVKYMALGDLHFPQDYSNIHYCGAPWRMTFAQEDKSCGFNVIDSNTWQFERIEVPSRKFRTLTQMDDVKIDTLKDAIVRVFFKDFDTIPKWFYDLKKVAKVVRVVRTSQEIIAVQEPQRHSNLKELCRQFLKEQKRDDLITLLEGIWND